ncbi:ribonuclease HI [Sutterella sp.]|uniref:ribonuclease HI n=1 Tax=Sutterella sp. TaxID=1981025 RepID=UPI0026DF5F77|nr:ribonuclease HI [Sutterella sp.]MDO5532635.1 ribonuclease HI [Sutterella sp.]
MTEKSPSPRPVEIWTDGACKNNPGVGGWGAWLVWGEHTLELYDGETLTTNNQMELTAVINALSAMKRPCPIIIHTDSSYVKDGITKWIHGWKRNGWRTADKKPVKNAELWQKLDELVSAHSIEWRWVKGHAGDPGNEKADELANLGVEAALGKRPAKRLK